MKEEIGRIIARVVDDAEDADGLTSDEIKEVIRTKLGGISLRPYGAFIEKTISQSIPEDEPEDSLSPSSPPLVPRRLELLSDDESL